ncbi:hypothetical protein ONZ45_g10211 [Pleurotus djamor]|nr:hypothetical protein ONZ45_g10211 [Pleurotus djamor]
MPSTNENTPPRRDYTMLRLASLGPPNLAPITFSWLPAFEGRLTPLHVTPNEGYTVKLPPFHGMPPLKALQEVQAELYRDHLDSESEGPSNTVNTVGVDADGYGDGNLEEEKPEVAAEKKKQVKRVWGAADLVELARVAIKEKPFLAPYGKKTATWQSICDTLMLPGSSFRVPDVKALAIQHKVHGLVEYKKNPKSNDREAKAIAKLLRGTSHDISIQALLEVLEKQFDEAKDKSDESKAETKRKLDEDEIGGKAIRDASMVAMKGKQPAAASKSDVIASSSHTPDLPSPPPSKRVKRESSGAEIIKLLKDEAGERKVHYRNIERLMEKADTRGQEMKDIFAGFLEIERARFASETN